MAISVSATSMPQREVPLCSIKLSSLLSKFVSYKKNKPLLVIMRHGWEPVVGVLVTDNPRFSVQSITI